MVKLHKEQTELVKLPIGAGRIGQNLFGAGLTTVPCTPLPL